MEEQKAKTKKPFYKKWWFWVIAVIVVIGALGNSNETTDGETKPATETQQMKETKAPEETPDIKLSTDFEKEVWTIAKNNGGKLHSIETIKSEKSDETTVIAFILCENNEETVKNIANSVSKCVKKLEVKTGIVITIGDIDEGEDAPALAMVSVDPDGTSDIASMSMDYNSERNLWIKGQFSAWDGSHKELEKLIKSRLNDEDSYKHKETTYTDVLNEEIKDKVNKILSDAGYSQRVEVGDLFIQTTFTAKNGFGGTVKNTAFGIASYKNNTITLVDIG